MYLQTTCLATLANMAPHAHHLSAYASQRLVSLFYMLSRKYAINSSPFYEFADGSYITEHELFNRYNKLSELTGDKVSIKISLSGEDLDVSEDLV